MTAARAGDAGMLDRIAYAGMFVFGIVMALLGAVICVGGVLWGTGMLGRLMAPAPKPTGRPGA